MWEEKKKRRKKWPNGLGGRKRWRLCDSAPPPTLNLPLACLWRPGGQEERPRRRGKKKKTVRHHFTTRCRSFTMHRSKNKLVPRTSSATSDLFAFTSMCVHACACMCVCGGSRVCLGTQQRQQDNAAALRLDLFTACNQADPTLGDCHIAPVTSDPT